MRIQLSDMKAGPELVPGAIKTYDTGGRISITKII
jgi:hypothetical protein